MINNPSKILLLSLLILLTSAFKMDNALPYNVKSSSDYAYFSGLAYCPKKCLENWSCKSGAPWKMVDVAHINNDITLAACFIAYNKDSNEIIVSFRGSANIQNWIEDFNIEMMSYDCKGCEIHAGFFNDYLLIEQKINKKIEELTSKYSTASIVCTGHSMGAALSEIAGLRLKAKFSTRQVHVHNFGCPRIGNAALAQFLAPRVDSLYRVVHHKDIVPHLPPESALYHHSPLEVFWNEAMTEYVICSETGEDKKCSNQYAPDYSAKDHDFYFVDLGTLKC